jgi:hypothetical protein
MYLRWMDSLEPLTIIVLALSLAIAGNTDVEVEEQTGYS